MKTLIIGANGNLGKEVLKQLSKTTSVKAGYRTPEKHNIKYNEEIVAFNYDDPQTFEKALENVDKVFVQAPPLDAFASQRMTPFINTLKQKGIKRVVLNSALGVNHNEEAPLRKVERSFIDKEFDYTIVRPNFFVENFTSSFVADLIKHKNAIIANAGDGKITFISVKDIAGVVTATINDEKHIGKEYNLTGGQALSHKEVADIFTEKLGKKINYISITANEMKSGAMENGLLESSADYLVMLNSMAKNGYMEHNTNEIEQLLGRSPLTFESVI
ncbi:NAD(P)H-binding protein [Aquimarina rhabdastrellae]